VCREGGFYRRGAKSAEGEEEDGKTSIKRLDVLALLSYDASEVNAMDELSRRSTIYFAPELHQALKVKAASTQTTVSDLVNDAVRALLREDEEDLAAFEARANEPTLSYEALLKDLKAHGKI